jgi:hypothetical protein
MALALRQPFRRREPSRTSADERDDAQASRPGTARVAAARGAWAAGSVLTLIARIVRLIAVIIALLIVAAILLRVLSANPGNTIVRDIHDVARTLVGPFKNIFSLKNAKVSIAVNWGIAAIVYLVVGSVIASLIMRLAPRGVHPSQPVR